MTVAASQDLEKTKKTIIKVLTTCEEESAEDERHGVALFVKPKKTDPRKHDRPTSKTDSIEGGAGAARRAPRRGIKPTGHGTRLQRALPPEGEEQLRDGNHWTKNRPNKTSTGKANRVRQGSTSRVLDNSTSSSASQQATDEPFVRRRTTSTTPTPTTLGVSRSDAHTRVAGEAGAWAEGVPNKYKCLTMIVISWREKFI